MDLNTLFKEFIDSINLEIDTRKQKAKNRPLLIKDGEKASTNPNGTIYRFSDFSYNVIPDSPAELIVINGKSNQDDQKYNATIIGVDDDVDALLTVALYYSQNKQPESALNVLRDFQTNVHDQMKAGAIGEIIDQLSTTNKEEVMRVLTGATEILDSIPDRDWKYLIGLKNDDYTKITLKYIEFKQYDRAIQIIDQKLNAYDVKVSASVKAILLYSKLNKVIDENRDDFINKVSSLTLEVSI